MPQCVGKKFVKSYDYHRGRGRRITEQNNQEQRLINRRGTFQAKEIIKEGRRPSDGKDNTFNLR